MLSEIHNANFISFWLKEFVRLGGSVPNEFCIDMSAALSNAAVNAFTTYKSLNEYVNLLFDMNFESTETAPDVQLRFDIAHVMAHVAKCKELSNVKPKVRETYIRCVGLLIIETSINEARKIILSVLTIAYSPTEGNCIFYYSKCYRIINDKFDCCRIH